MPNRSDIHIDRALTSISVKYMQDPENFIADKVFPMVPVQKQSDRYFKYLRDDWFRDDAQLRAPGTESAGGNYDIDNTPSYFCNKYAFHRDITEEEKVNADAPLEPMVDAVAFVTDKLLLQKENEWARTFFKPGVWETDIKGDANASGHGDTSMLPWDDPNSTPIADIRRFGTNMAEVTGKRPNTLTLSRRVYDALCEHPDMLDRIKFTQRGVVSHELLAALLDIDRILVADAIQNVRKKQQGEDRKAEMEFIMGQGALLTYSAPSPALRQATAGYTFAWTGLMGSNALGGRTNRFVMPELGIGTERIEQEWAYDMKVVAPDLGMFIEDAVQIEEEGTEGE